MNLFTGRTELEAKPSVVHQRETHFSWLRTRMSVERTLMSWVRTATALIGFGFTIFQFFERFNQMPDVAAARSLGTARAIALGLVGAGTGALFIAILVPRDHPLPLGPGVRGHCGSEKWPPNNAGAPGVSVPRSGRDHCACYDRTADSPRVGRCDSMRRT